MTRIDDRLRDALKVLPLGVAFCAFTTFLALKSALRCYRALLAAGVGQGSAWWLVAGGFVIAWPFLALFLYACTRGLQREIRAGQVPILKRKGPITPSYIATLAVLAPAAVLMLKATVGRAGILVLAPIAGALEAAGLATLYGCVWLVVNASRRRVRA